MEFLPIELIRAQRPDDLPIEAYTAAQRTYMGAQRKGVRDALPKAQSYETHLKGALALPFPMALETP